MEYVLDDNGILNQQILSMCVSGESENGCSTDSAITEKLHEIDLIKEVNALSPLRASLFPNIPPTINFSCLTERIKVEILSDEIQKLLNWKMSTISPRLVLQIVNRSGFNITGHMSNWTSTWGKYMKCNEFKTLKEYQKVNHFPGSFYIGRKDRLWSNIMKMNKKFRDEEFCFMPETYILPQDMKNLVEIWKEEEINWIVKPPASARGTGVTVINRWEDIPKNIPVIVQRYLSQPYLVNGTKFDLRIYVLVTSFYPLKIYIYNNGLVRFASVKYSNSKKHLGEKFMHLTNYSINCKNSSYTVNNNIKLCNGHKWTLKSLWKYLQQYNIDTDKVWSCIKDVVVKTMISCEDPIGTLVRSYTKNRYSCYELFGFDILLDRNLKPWLLEVNISPSLHSNSELDKFIKCSLIKDVLNTVGLHIPSLEISVKQQQELLAKCNITNTKFCCFDNNIYTSNLKQEEKVKQTRHELGYWTQSTILNRLSVDDIKILIQSEDELSRCGNFIRIFPSKGSSKYLKYFEKSKYYNLLLDAWENKYFYNRKEGIKLLLSLCNDLNKKEL
ncbi:tubulin monoglutamylase TTLL4-like [Centruroides vittatus]|uniref:tubulin monoglutamylase TTLL4-like n=1 Tax=Centruroides vittatus TaxID=120091 RepID=UPI00350FF066